MTERTLEAQQLADAWNEANPIGAHVRFWTGLRKGRGETSVTRTEASVLGGQTAVVWIEGEGPCVALTHVERIPALLGAAVLDGGSWFASEKLDAPMVKDYRRTVKVYGNRRDWFMTPDTARSMASALNVYADRAEAFDATA